MAHTQVGFLTAAETGITVDDQRGIAALNKIGISVAPVIWDQPSPLAPETPLIFRSCWDYHFKREKFAALLEEWQRTKRPVFNPPSVAIWNFNKTYLEALRTAGFSVPRTVWLEAGGQYDLETVLRKNDLNEVVIKPAVSMNGDDTWRSNVKDAHKTQSQLEALRDRRVMIQEFLPEILTSGEFSFVFFNGKFSHAVQKTPQANEFRIHQDRGGTFKQVHPSANALAKAEKILRFEKETLLYARVDVLPVGDNFVVMELEFLDPSLYLKYDPEAAMRFAQAVKERIAVL